MGQKEASGLGPENPEQSPRLSLHLLCFLQTSDQKQKAVLGVDPLGHLTVLPLQAEEVLGRLVPEYLKGEYEIAFARSSIQTIAIPNYITDLEQISVRLIDSDPFALHPGKAKSFDDDWLALHRDDSEPVQDISLETLLRSLAETQIIGTFNPDGQPESVYLSWVHPDPKAKNQPHLLVFGAVPPDQTVNGLTILPPIHMSLAHLRQLATTVTTALHRAAAAQGLIQSKEVAIEKQESLLVKAARYFLSRQPSPKNSKQEPRLAEALAIKDFSGQPPEVITSHFQGVLGALFPPDSSAAPAILSPERATLSLEIESACEPRNDISAIITFREGVAVVGSPKGNHLAVFRNGQLNLLEVPFKPKERVLWGQPLGETKWMTLTEKGGQQYLKAFWRVKQEHEDSLSEYKIGLPPLSPGEIIMDAKCLERPLNYPDQLYLLLTKFLTGGKVWICSSESIFNGIQLTTEDFTEWMRQTPTSEVLYLPGGFIMVGCEGKTHCVQLKIPRSKISLESRERWAENFNDWYRLGGVSQVVQARSQNHLAVTNHGYLVTLRPDLASVAEQLRLAFFSSGENFKGKLLLGTSIRGTEILIAHLPKDETNLDATRLFVLHEESLLKSLRGLKYIDDIRNQSIVLASATLAESAPQLLSLLKRRTKPVTLVAIGPEPDHDTNFLLYFSNGTVARVKREFSYQL